MKFSIFFVLTFFLNPPAFSSASSVSSADLFCAELQQGRDQIKGVNRWTVLRDFLNLAVRPGKLVQLSSSPIPISSELRTDLPTSASNDFESKHLIFSISPPESELNSADLPNLRKAYQTLKAEISAQTPFLMSLIYAPSTEECKRRMTEAHFDHEHFLGLLEQQSQYRLLDQIDEAHHAEKAIRKMLRRSTYSWRVISSTDLFLVHQALKDPEVKDVVIVAHGLSGGKLIDSRYNQYPLGFFDELSPNLRSLTLFACHGQETGSAYQISKALSQGPSIHPNRALFISEGSLLAGRDELVPVSAFRSFMKRVERELHRMDIEEESQAPPISTRSAFEPTCQLNLSRFSVTEGTFGFFLNGHFVGSSHEVTPDLQFEYPCRFLDRFENIFVIRSLGLTHNAKVKTLEFEVRPQFPGKTIVLGPLMHFERSDHSYQGSRLNFSVINGTN